MKQAEKTDMLLALIRERKPMTVAQQLQLTSCNTSTRRW